MSFATGYINPCQRRRMKLTTITCPLTRSKLPMPVISEHSTTESDTDGDNMNMRDTIFVCDRTKWQVDACFDKLTNDESENDLRNTDRWESIVVKKCQSPPRRKRTMSSTSQFSMPTKSSCAFAKENAPNNSTSNLPAKTNGSRASLQVKMPCRRPSGEAFLGSLSSNTSGRKQLDKTLSPVKPCRRLSVKALGMQDDAPCHSPRKPLRKLSSGSLRWQ